MFDEVPLLIPEGDTENLTFQRLNLQEQELVQMWVHDPGLANQFSFTLL